MRRIRRGTRAWTALCVGLWMAASASAFQAGVHEYPGATNRDGFGMAVAVLDDLDADGWSDLAVGATSDDQHAWNGGSVTILSARTGGVLWMWNGTHDQQRLGEVLCLLGDLDGDGFCEIAASASGDNRNGTQSGSAYVFNPRTGGLLYVVSGASAGDQCGLGLSSMDDVNGDQIADFAVGSWLSDANGRDAGLVQIFSGATGLELHRMSGNSPEARFGRSIACLGDLDGDRWIDFAVGAPRTSRLGIQECGEILLCSTGLQSPWRSIPGSRPNGCLGQALARIPDCDGDGKDELAGSAPEGDHPGEAWLWSPGSGTVLQHWIGSDTGDRFGFTLSSAGDVDLDGTQDVLIGAPMARREARRYGAVRFHSGADGNLLAQYFGLAVRGGFGGAAAHYPDLNGDSVPESVVGAPSAFIANRPGSLFLLLAWEPHPLVVSPLRAGGSASATVSGLSYGDELRLYAGLFGWGWGRHGSTRDELDILQPTAVGTAWADATGQATVHFQVPPGLAGKTVWMQGGLRTQMGTPRSNSMPIMIQ